MTQRHATRDGEDARVVRRTIGQLDVRRGRTRFPARPVHGPRFTIGSAPACDLRLGGDVVPPIHSTIVVDGDGRAWLEAVSHEPPLLVNGHPSTQHVLRMGDEIAVGPFAFAVRLAAHAGDPEPGPSPAELSAAELVERLEDELGLVEAWEHDSRGGTEELLAAVAERRAVELPQMIADPGWRDLLESFDALARRLERRNDERGRREDRLRTAAAELLERQRAVEHRLERLGERAADVAGTNAAPDRRAA